MNTFDYYKLPIACRHLFLLFIACCTLIFSQRGFAAIPAHLLDTQQATHDVQFVSLHNNQIAYFDSSGELQRKPVADFIRLTFTTSSNPYHSLERPAASWQHIHPSPLAQRLEQVNKQLTNNLQTIAPFMGYVKLTDGQILAGMPSRVHFSPASRAKIQTQFGSDLAQLNGILNEFTDQTPEQLVEQIKRIKQHREQWFSQNEEHENALHWHPQSIRSELTIPIESIQTMLLSQTHRPHPFNQTNIRNPDGFDQITLRNQDTMHGLIMGIERQELQLALPDTNQTIAIPMENILGIQMDHTVNHDFTNHQLVHLYDGSQIFLADISIREKISSQWILTGDMPMGDESIPVELPLDTIEQIDILTSSYRYMPLTYFAYEIVSGGEPFGVRVPIVQHGSTLLIPGPIHVRWQIPADNIDRMTGRISLSPPGHNPDAIRFADIQYELRIGGKTLQGTLHANKKTVEIDIAGNAQVIELILKSGTFGPMLHRVQLEDFHLLLRNN